MEYPCGTRMWVGGGYSVCWENGETVIVRFGSVIMFPTGKLVFQLESGVMSIPCSNVKWVRLLGVEKEVEYFWKKKRSKPKKSGVENESK